MRDLERKIIAVALLCIIMGGIVAVFWVHEIKYQMPTALPGNYNEVPLGTPVSVNAIIEYEGPKLLHFYNPECPCSKFNAAHIKYLHARYGKEVRFFIVTEKELNDTRDEFNVPVIFDEHGILADACGVYSTPQAVLLNHENNLYYRGNYNKARYCTTKNTNFAEIAIVNLLEGNNTGEFSEIATRSYGCQLGSDITNKQ